MFIQWLAVLADPRFITLSASDSDWKANDDNWRLVGVAEVGFMKKSFEDEEGIECELCGAGGSPDLMNGLQSFLCRSPFVARFSEDMKGCNKPVIEAQSPCIKPRISYPSLFRSLQCDTICDGLSIPSPVMALVVRWPLSRRCLSVLLAEIPELDQ